MLKQITNPVNSVKEYNDIYAPITQTALDQIPAGMKAADRWVVWGGNKCPVNGNSSANGFLPGADITDSRTWMSFEKAVSLIGAACFVKRDDMYFRVVGIGFVVGDGYFCIDANGGAAHGREPVPAAVISDLCRRTGTYAETSISGNGCHVFDRCDFVTEDGKEHFSESKTSYEIEFFTRRKYIAITGNRIPYSSADLVDCSEAARQIYADYVLSGCRRREEEEKKRREEYRKTISINPNDSNQFFLLNYPEILMYSDSSNFRRSGKGSRLGPGEYSWIGAVKSMQEIGVPEDAIMEWCRRGSNFRDEKDVLRVLREQKYFRNGTSCLGSIIQDAKNHGWKPAPEKLTGEYKKAHDDAVQRRKDMARIEQNTKGHFEAGAPETGEIAETCPEWLMVFENSNGQVTKKVNEPLFCEMFQKENDVVRINGVFYLKGEQVSDDLILAMIQKMISPYFPERTGRKTTDLFITLQNAAFVKQPAPDERRIYCGNDLTIMIDEHGDLSFNHEKIFTLSRLDVNYNPDAVCPTFMKYLDDLLYPEDIPAVQEYIGYCLVPSTRAQSGLFIHGQGGEGKSVPRDVLMKLFGHSAVQEGIHQLSERFVMANLENKLLCIDDDMRSDKLSDTAVIKKLITNSPNSPIQVERKNKQKYDSFIFARIFAIGNTFIGSKFDHSDGFYRRQLLIDCKPKTRPEDQDDRRMGDKCIAEIDGIFNWALCGLIRLVKNGYHFTVSKRMKQTLDDVKHEGDNSLTFFEDDSVIMQTDSDLDQITAADLFVAYALWCFNNGDPPIRRRSFLNRASERFKIHKIRIQTANGRQQGYSYLKLSDYMSNRVKYCDEKTMDRINRLP